MATIKVDAVFWVDAEPSGTTVADIIESVEEFIQEKVCGCVELNINDDEKLGVFIGLEGVDLQHEYIDECKFGYQEEEDV
jgi:hypothetical protein